MAGIGWKLQRLIDQESLAGATAAYATGAAVMALPWVLTTAVLVSLPAILGAGSTDFATAGTVVSVAYSAALLVDGPLQVVISRYTADRLYEERLGAVAAPLCRGLVMVFLISALTTVTALLVIGLPLGIASWGGALSAAVGAQWTALSVGNGLCSPGLVLGAVTAGAVQSLVLAATLVALGGLGVPGYLFGLIVGQSLTLAILLVGIFKELPEGSDESAKLLPAFREYAPLAGAGFAFNAALWVDKLEARWSLGVEGGSMHAAASTLAWFLTIPCLAWIFVEVETAFHRRFRAFFLALEEGASLTELRRGVQGLVGETGRLFRGACGVQAGVTIFFLLAADPLIHWLNLPPSAVLPFRLLLIGAGMQALALLGLILLYYFDLRRDALLAASCLFAGVAVLTAVAPALGLPPSAGTVLGCAVGGGVTWHRVTRGVNAALQHTLLGEPFGAEHSATHES